MDHDHLGRRARDHQQTSQTRDDAAAGVPGRRTLTEQLGYASPIDELIARARAGGGAGLDGSLRDLLEQALGTSLGDVKLHASADADKAARAVDASAFALGQDVFFSTGQLDPATPAGRGLIAHEVAHTVQQRGASHDGGPARVSSPDDHHEAEADRFVASFLAGGTAPISPVRAGSISRKAIARQAAGTQAPAPAAPAPAAPAPATPVPGARFEIVKDRPAAVVGQPATFSVPGAEPHTKMGARYVCSWTVHFDAASAKAKGIEPIYTLRPTQQRSQPYITLNFEIPGKHRVTCDIKWEGTGKPPGQPAYSLETMVSTRNLDDISRDALQNFDALESQTKVGTVLADASSPEAAKAGAAHDKAADELKGKLGKQVPVRAVISDGMSGHSYALSMVIGSADLFTKTARGPGVHSQGFKLLDLTRGVKRAEYEGATAQEALSDLRSGNSYPAGMLELEIPANEHGIPPTKLKFNTSGMSNLEEWAHALGLVSIALAGVATVMTGGVAAPLLVWASTATAAIGAAVTLADDLKATKLDSTTIVVDVIQLTASLLPFVGPAAKLAAGGKKIVEIAQMPGRWIQLGQLGLDGVGGLLISVEAYDQLSAELAKPELQGPDKKSEREKHIILFIAGLVQQGAIIGMSAKGVPPKAPRHVPTTPRSKINDETARHLKEAPPERQLHVEWTEDGVTRKGLMTPQELEATLKRPGVTAADIDAVHQPVAPPKDGGGTAADIGREATTGVRDIKDTYRAKQLEARERLKSGRDWLADFQANGNQITVKPGEVSVPLIKDLTLVTQSEIGLYRLEDGRRVMTLGGASHSLKPDEKIRRLILHSHPDGDMMFSDDDVLTLLHSGKDAKGQLSSVLITPVISGAAGDAKRLNVDKARLEKKSPDKPWFDEPSLAKQQADQNKARVDARNKDRDVE